MWGWFVVSVFFSVWSVVARLEQQTLLAVVTGFTSVLLYGYGCYLIWSWQAPQGDEDVSIDRD